MNEKRILSWVTCAVFVATAVTGFGGEGKRESDQREAKEVELFAAISDGQIDVAVVPQSYASLTLRVRNKTREPLKIKLPEVFAAVPTARLQTPQAMQNRGAVMSLANGYGYGQDQGGSQGLGGFLSGPWSGRSLTQEGNAKGEGEAAQEGPRYWILAPGRLWQTQVPCFCLEFGKPDPNSRIPYTLRPLKELNNKPAVSELLEEFARQGLNQYVAQLAAWHVANDVPWHMLTKVQFPRSPRNRGHRVTQMELVAAKNFAESLPSYGRQASLGDQ